MRTKDIYYKNAIYKISITDLKHVNGYDVAKLPNEVYVYYDDLDKKWKNASQILIQEYTGKHFIDVEFNGQLVKTLSYLDLEENIDDKKITKVNIECFVKYDDDKKIWNILDNTDPLYKDYLRMYDSE